MNPLWDNIFRKKNREESLAYFLGTVPIFAELSTRELKALEAIVHVRRYEAQETIFSEGDPGSGIYVVRSGQVRIFNRGYNGHEEDLAILEAGDFFGETTLTAPACRSASASTLEPSELIGLFRADLLEMAGNHPAITNKILLALTRIVSERLEAAGQEMRRLKQTGAPVNNKDRGESRP